MKKAVVPYVLGIMSCMAIIAVILALPTELYVTKEPGQPILLQYEGHWIEIHTTGHYAEVRK